MSDTTNDEYCYSAFQYNLFVYGLCNGVNAFTGDIHFPLVVKFMHDGSKVLYVRSLIIDAYQSNLHSIEMYV